jgi:putative ABC transport system permease protein
VAVRIAVVTSAENTQGPIHFTRTDAPGRFGNHPSCQCSACGPCGEACGTPSDRFRWLLTWIFTGLVDSALGLASIGLYGLIAFSVAQRAREIGIRVALGASRAGVFSMILRDALCLTLIGGIVGLVAIIGLTRFLRSLLFEIQPLDPVTLVSVICVLLSVSLLACYVPARRATNADPAAVLREE